MVSTQQVIKYLRTNPSYNYDRTSRTVPALRGAVRAVGAAECARRVWCGAPYYLPVRSLIPRSLAAPAPAPPLVVLAANVTTARLDPRTLEVRLRLAGAQHAVVVCAAAAGARVVWSSAGGAPLEAPRWAGRRVYFFALHDARAARPFSLALRLQREEGAAAPAPAEDQWAALSVAGHALFGAHKEAPAHARLLAALPPWVAATGWGVDLHLYSL